MSANQFQQRPQSQHKTEKTLGIYATSNKELKEQKQINLEQVIGLEYVSKKEENVNLHQFQNQSYQNDKQKKKTIPSKELRYKSQVKINQDINHHHQTNGAEDELQVVQEASQKITQKKTFIVKTENLPCQCQSPILQKIQEMEYQLKVQQQEIEIFRQNQSKEILPKSNQTLLNEELKKDNFQLPQCIQLQINEQNRNYYKKIENQISQFINSFTLEQKSNQKSLEQLKQWVKVDSENKEKKIIDLVQQDLECVKIEIEKADKSLMQLTNKLNQITQIQETFQRDLTKLQQFLGGKSRQPQIKEEQICQITQEQLNQLNCLMDEKARNIQIYVDHHLENLQQAIVLSKKQYMFYYQRGEKSEIYEIKDALLQEQKKNFDQILNLISTEKLGIKQQLQFQLETLFQKEYQIQKQKSEGNACSSKPQQNNFVESDGDLQKNQIIQLQNQNQKNIKFLSINDSVYIDFDLSRSQSIKKHINQLYNESSRKRDTETQYQFYLRKVQSEKELFEYYSINNPQTQMELKKHCLSFRQVRGDGNCFYSAFGFQYMELLIRFSDYEFSKFKDLILGKFQSKITYQNFNTDQIPNFSNYLTFEFIYRIQQLRKISDLAERQIQLEKEFAAHTQETEEIDGCLYGLVIIFFRNLSNYLYENSEMFLVITENNNILIWEQEFNSTELIISELAKFLKIYVVLIFFEKNVFKVQEYEPNNQYKIILLIRPGHYNIGIQ
ncbi:unnamed protein product [Paramecium pentaurelia]|uniref:OTU domain-containing protein n=1 Tax=Paramecium pentaurelia TaxID=43138 RepID=A0A8S1XVS3_9CILI|nr:unnamed protein product [Paramecium pentaurelia]